MYTSIVARLEISIITSSEVRDYEQTLPTLNVIGHYLVANVFYFSNLSYTFDLIGADVTSILLLNITETRHNSILYPDIIESLI